MADELNALPLHLKYRPQLLDDLIGQKDAVKALAKAIKEKKQHSYLLKGPSGVGKTTSARIMASEIGCSAGGVVEIDAGQYSSVDNIRRIVEASEYRSIAATPEKMIIIDECQRLSSPAWSALLKPIEEPPQHCFWALCTTEGDKVPVAIRTRCHTVEFRKVNVSTVTKYLEAIDELEQFNLDPDIVQLCARQCDGSVRQALVYLAAVSDCQDVKEARQIISAVEESGDLGKFMRQLCDGSLRWTDATFHLTKLQDEDPEGIRLAIVNYVQKAVLSAKQPPDRLLAVLDAFSKPCNRSDKMAPLLTAIGRIVK